MLDYNIHTNIETDIINAEREHHLLTVSLFIDFLSKVQYVREVTPNEPATNSLKNTWHVVYKHGTVVRIDTTDIPDTPVWMIMEIADELLLDLRLDNDTNAPVIPMSEDLSDQSESAVVLWGCFWPSLHGVIFNIDIGTMDITTYARAFYEIDKNQLVVSTVISPKLEQYRDLLIKDT